MDVPVVAVVSACVGAVVCAGIYVLWGPDQLLKRRGHCPGLANLGNTCFLNAVLQALASLSLVRVWLRGREHEGKLASALNTVLGELSEGEGGVCSPDEVLQALSWHRWTINFQQQDAHELYHVLLTTLGEEMAPCHSLLAGVHHLLEGDEESEGRVAWTRGGCLPLTLPLACPLQGLLTSELLCCHCHYTFPHRYETFDSLPLPLPSHVTVCSLQACLLDFVKSELVYNVECPQCSKVAGKKVRTTFMKQLQLCRAPRCLCVHLQRTVWLPDGQLYKNSTRVSFPLQLEVGSFTRRTFKEGEQPPLVYELVAVIEHMGNPLSGHYVTYRCHDVLRANPYMLFYERQRN